MKYKSIKGLGHRGTLQAYMKHALETRSNDLMKCIGNKIFI